MRPAAPSLRAIPGRDLYGAAPTADGRIVVLNSHEGSNRWHLIGVEPETGRVRWTIPAEGSRAVFAPVAAMQFRAEHVLLEVATTDGNVIRFNALTGRELRRFRVDGRPPEERDAQPDRPTLPRSAFSADGRTLASTARDWIYIWDVESGMIRREIHLAHEDGCVIALSPDGRTLAIGTGPFPEDAIRLVEVETGKEWLVLNPGDRGPRLLIFSPDGTKLFAGFDRGSGIVWDVRRPEGGAGERGVRSIRRQGGVMEPTGLGSSIGFGERMRAIPPEGRTPSTRRRPRQESGFSRSGIGGHRVTLAMVLILAPGRLRAADEGPPLPPRGLVRIGTDDLRTHGLHHGARVLARRPTRRRLGRQ